MGNNEKAGSLRIQIHEDEGRISYEVMFSQDEIDLITQKRATLLYIHAQTTMVAISDAYEIAEAQLKKMKSDGGFVDTQSEVHRRVLEALSYGFFKTAEDMGYVEAKETESE